MDASKYYKESKESKDGTVEVETRVHSEHVHANPHSTMAKLSSLFKSRAFAIALIIVILLIAVYARLGLAGSEGLFEPDGFFYYSVVRATINNHLMVPQHLGISGFPTPNFIGEAPGLPYLTVIFYLLIGWAGLSYLTIMRFLPVLFGLLEAVLAYFIAKELSNSRELGILAMFFVAVSSGNIARTAALVYRGDSFIALPLMVTLYLAIIGFKSEDTKKLAVLSLACAFIISTGILIWNGSPYIIAIYMIGLAALILYAFIRGSKDLSKKALIFTLGLILTAILQDVYVALGAGRPHLQLQGISFVVFYIPILIAALFVFYITERRLKGLFGSTLKRVMFAIVLCIALAVIMLVLFPGYITHLSGAVGVPPPPTNQSRDAMIGYAITVTTQELQTPSYNFLFASFGLQLFIAPIGVLLFILLGGKISGDEKARGGLRSKATIAFIFLLVYLVITAYLQYNAIRYNALFSIPLAIFAAYGLYAIGKLCTKVELKRGLLRTILAVIICVIALYVLYRAYYIATSGLSGNGSIFVGAGVIIGAIMIILLIDTAMALSKNRLRLHRAALAIIAVIMVFSFAYTIVETFGSVQADGINPQFLGAMSWMKNNTPSNAKVLALWPDGSVVEGWANRTSYMDSVGGEASLRIYHFARFLENTTPDTQYLYGIGKPDYLVSRQYWMIELQGLVAEGVPQNAQDYNYVVFYPVGIQRNSTAQFYTFRSALYNVTLIGKSIGNGTEYSAYLSSGGPSVARIQRIVFYNTSNYGYNIVETNQSTLNYTFMLFFSGSRITGAMLMTDQLYNTNLFKFVFLCNQYECPYNAGSNATLRLVYVNNDTRIFKINYTS